MATKLPDIIKQEEFEKIYQEAKRLESTAVKKSKKRRIRQYRLAMLLGFEAGMRISEIVGLKGLLSMCHKKPIITKKVIVNNKKILGRLCPVCRKYLPLKKCQRLVSGGWDIPPLTKEQIDFQGNSIKIISGKGKKDRIVSLPKRINEEAIKMLPLTIKRRALEDFTALLGKKVLGKDIHFHTLRHSFATHFYGKTKDIRSLQVLLGHSRLDTTSIYAHINPVEAIAKAREVF